METETEKPYFQLNQSPAHNSSRTVVRSTSSCFDKNAKSHQNLLPCTSNDVDAKEGKFHSVKSIIEDQKTPILSHSLSNSEEVPKAVHTIGSDKEADLPEKTLPVPVSNSTFERTFNQMPIKFNYFKHYR